MEKKEKNNNLDDWIKAEYGRETHEIEENLSDDGSFDPDKIDSEALYQRIMEQIQKKEKNQEGNQEENQEGDQSKKKMKKRVNMYQVRKCAAVFVVSVVGIFLASMTSEANRAYLQHTIQYIVGNEVVIEKGNDESGEGESVVEREEEFSVYQEIEEKVGIPVPFFQYEPEMRTGFQYNIELGDAIATLEYQYGDAIINLRMTNSNRTEAYGVAVHGKVIKEISILKGVVTIPVQKIKDTGDEEPTYAAQWEYNGGYYQLSGKIKEKDFLEVVKNICY